MAQINKPNEYFNTVTYSGNSSNNRTISGFGFDPDFAWVKCRTSAFSHTLADIVRGTNANLFANETGAEINPTTDIGNGGIGQVTTDGFIAVQGTSSMNNTNQSGEDYVAWSWKAGGTASSNTDGSITSNVSANTTSGFSIVSYTGNATANATVGHGLGVAPSMIIVKKRNGVYNWGIYHKSLTAHKLLAFTTGAPDDDPSYWNDVEPNSSVFNLGNGALTNGSGSTMIAYCFAEKKGFSKFGSYTGNGSTDGTFVYTGFKPAFVILKNTNAVQDWSMKDNKRPGYNVTDDILYPNGNYAEGSGGDIDILSNGFKARTTADNTNQSGSTFIYMAFAENPLVGTNNTPATAR